jgi:glycosyltransferase involved in cell wall biosynthesis
MQVIPNGIPLPAVLDTISRRATRAALFQRVDDCVVFGSIGRLVALKNHALLLDAFADVARYSPAARLVIVGDGPLRAELEHHSRALGLQGLVLFAGYRDDARELAAAFDVYVQTSNTEGYSIALLEAAGAGLPIIATDVGGNAAIVRHGWNGTLIGARDRESLAAAMTAYLDVDKRRISGDRGRQWAHESASIDRTAALYAKVYDDARGATLSG